MLTRRVAAPASLALAVVGMLAGCGGSGGSSTAGTAAPAELQAARRQGEEAAKERDRVAGLQRQVRTIRRRLRHHHAQQTSPAPAPTESGSASNAAAPDVAGGPVRSFHAPSGNVSCEVFGDGATCTVASVGLTFVLEPGNAARIESGAALSSGLGELVGYGNVVSVGSITCEVPPSDVPRGITCVDRSDGHGFEASRDASRQEAY
ncbi:MAG TPA: hypothetical protein VMF55_02610 [Solirubrobacterales bacterium]|nr:hypothetical protein [Solirubrobacterales bacterium]